jgi:competence protein ComEC
MGGKQGAGKMERPWVYGTVCYLSGIVLGEAWTYYPLSTLGLMVIGTGTAGLFSLRPRTVWFFGMIVLLILFGMIRTQIATRPHRHDDLARFATRTPVRLIGVVDRPLRHGPESTLISVNALSVESEGREFTARGRARIAVRDFVPDLEYGDRLSAIVRLRPVSGLRNPGSYDYAAVLRRGGIRALATIHRREAYGRSTDGRFSPLRTIYAWRERIRRMLDGSLSSVSSEILQAMLIGETRSLSSGVREAFMNSGTSHLLSISGSHLAMVAFVVFQASGCILRRIPAHWLLRASRRLTVTRLCIPITLVPVVFYTLLAGGQIATVRSLVMILVYMAAVWFQRADDPLNALAIAAFLVALWDPQAVFSISFQLSYTAVLSMALIGEKGRLFLKDVDSPLVHSESERSGVARMLKKLRAYMGMTITAGAATLPLTACYFNQISWVGFLANLIVVPLVGMLVVPLGLACSVGAILFGSTGLPLAGLNDLLARALFSIVEWFARFPASELHVPSPPIPVLIAVYLAAYLLLIRGGKRIVRWAAAGLCVLVVTVWIGRMWASHPDGRLHVTFLDVGQGDAAWIELPDGKTMLIDGGGAYGHFNLGRLAVAPYLWNTGHWRIDYLVASHPQLDHMGGLGYLASKFQIGELWTNGMKSDADFYKQFREIISARGIPEKRITSDDLPLDLDDARIRPLHPEASGSFVSVNDQSLVLRIEYRREAILFTGDIERPAERELLEWGDRLRSTVLKVPHHGSRTSIDADFLSRVDPAIAVISVGENNPYGHPSAETVAAYEAKKARIYRTDRDGAVIFATDGIQRTVRTYADCIAHPVDWGWGMANAEALNLKKIFHRYWFGPA